MASEDILQGLRNAIDRGENPSDAAQSFINAGYEEKEINWALRQITSGFSEKKFSLPKIEIPRKTLLLLPALEKEAKVEGKMPINLIEPMRSRPSPSKELSELPSMEVKNKKSFIDKLSDNALLLSIGVVGFLIVSLTIYLLYLFML